MSAGPSASTPTTWVTASGARSVSAARTNASSPARTPISASSAWPGRRTPATEATPGLDLLLGHRGQVGQALLLRVAVGTGQATVPGPDPRPDLVHGGRREHEEPEERQQGQQRPRNPRREQAHQWLTEQVPEHATRGVQPLEPVVQRRRAIGQVRHAAGRQDQGRDADAQPAVGRRPVRVTHQADRGEDQQQRDGHADHAEGARHHVVDDHAGRARQVPPLAGGDHHGKAEDRERRTVAAVRRVQVPGALSDAPAGAADQVRKTEPGAPDDPDRERGTARRRATSTARRRA